MLLGELSARFPAVLRAKDALEVAADDLTLGQTGDRGHLRYHFGPVMRLQLRLIADENDPSSRLDGDGQFARSTARGLVDDDQVEWSFPQPERRAAESHAGARDDLACACQEALETSFRRRNRPDEVGGQIEDR